MTNLSVRLAEAGRRAEAEQYRQEIAQITHRPTTGVNAQACIKDCVDLAAVIDAG